LPVLPLHPHHPAWQHRHIIAKNGSLGGWFSRDALRVVKLLEFAIRLLGIHVGLGFLVLRPVAHDLRRHSPL